MTDSPQMILPLSSNLTSSFSKRRLWWVEVAPAALQAGTPQGPHRRHLSQSNYIHKQVWCSSTSSSFQAIAAMLLLLTTTTTAKAIQVSLIKQTFIIFRAVPRLVWTIWSPVQGILRLKLRYVSNNLLITMCVLIEGDFTRKCSPKRHGSYPSL